MATWTPPRTWVAGETVTAALLNTHLRDNLLALGQAWTSYTVTWTCNTTNPVIGNGTITGKWVSVGKLIHYSIDIIMGSTTTYGTGTLYSFTLPTAPLAGKIIAGSAICYDVSAIARYDTPAFHNGSSTICLATTSTAFASPTTPFTFANGDQISISGTYEAA